MDPRLLLALSLQSNPGVYALLLGSGVSRAAQIPTGWEVVLDLIGQVAAMLDEEIEGDPAEWYAKRFEAEPDYSDILGRLAPQPDERQRLLRSYFEATEEEAEEGLKRPTEAHRAIASLCKAGYIRVIVTTNFDRLLEQALSAEGLEPTVISTADAVEGAPPLTHADLTVVKIHGDYLDTRIRNTTGELEEYPEPLVRLLDRIFDEFGLVVCGWSAKWDPALRGALERSSNRRYTTYWTGIESPDDSLDRLLRLRQAQFIPIEGADEFFLDLKEKVLALDEYRRPHPLSVETAVATIKRYLPEERHMIRLHDLVMRETELAVEAVEQYPVGASFSDEELLKRVHAVESTTEILRAVAAVGLYWSAPRHESTWTGCVERLASLRTTQKPWGQLRGYPALLVVYAGGIAAVAAGNWSALHALLVRPTVPHRSRTEKVPAAVVTHPWAVLERDVARRLPDLGDKHTPASMRIEEAVRPALDSLIPDSDRYEELFDRFEYVLALVYSDVTGKDWGPVGNFGWRRRHSSNGPSKWIGAEVEEHGAMSGVLQAGFFDGDPDRFREAKQRFDSFLGRVTGGW